jgi:hypothetical protein
VPPALLGQFTIAQVTSGNIRSEVTLTISVEPAKHMDKTGTKIDGLGDEACDEGEYAGLHQRGLPGHDPQPDVAFPVRRSRGGGANRSDLRIMDDVEGRGPLEERALKPTAVKQCCSRRACSDQCGVRRARSPRGPVL